MNPRVIIHLIAAARPNFMKIAPLYHALRKESWVDPYIVHTGQHYDLNMSDVFFKDLGLPEPHIHLGIGSGSHAEQTGKVMIAYEKVLLEYRPDIVVVVGDVNSTLACALAASKITYVGSQHNGPARLASESVAGRQQTRPPRKRKRCGQATDNGRGLRPLVAHLEAGLRSFDRTMPEEINRGVTDSLSDILWTPSPDADKNLLREGIDKNKIVRVGNIMIDSLELLRPKIEREDIYNRFGLFRKKYGVITLHRPSNVDKVDTLKGLCDVFGRVGQKIPLIFPVHPRTKKNLEAQGLMGLLNSGRQLRIVDPLGYIPFMNLVFNSRLVITDSGGIQEETTYLGIPCLTLRPNTERPITISQGTNELCAAEKLESKVSRILSGKTEQSSVPQLWDGHTGERVVMSIKRVVGAS